MKSLLYFFGIALIILLGSSGCATVKPYQRVYLNDPEMQMGKRPGVTFGDYVHAIRSGSTVAGSKKASGGCGCN